MKCASSVAVAIGLITSVAVRAQTPFHRLSQASVHLLESEGLSGTEKSALEDIHASSTRLGKLFQEANGTAPEKAKLSEGYAKSLDADVETLLSTDQKERSSAIQGVRDDVRIKLKFAEGSLGFAGGFPANIKVTVETVREGKKVDGLWVRCNARRYGVTRNPAFVFNSASSPTTANLPPGLFVLWVESPDGKVLGSQPVEIGSTGSDSETIRFALP